MNALTARLRVILKDLTVYEPAILAWGLNGGLAVLLGSVLHISSTQEAAVTTIATAAVTAWTAIRTRPAAVSSITGALSAIAIAAGAFGLHLTSAQTGAAVAALSAVLALATRASVSPAVKAKGGTSA